MLSQVYVCDIRVYQGYTVIKGLLLYIVRIVDPRIPVEVNSDEGSYDHQAVRMGLVKGALPFLINRGYIVCDFFWTLVGEKVPVCDVVIS